MLTPIGPTSPVFLPATHRADGLDDHDLNYWLSHPADALDEIDRIECEESLLAFTRRHWHILEPGRDLSVKWPLEAMCEHLEAITYGQINRLLINVPPGFMKLIADETPILTPDGYRRHGDLAVGDKVFSPDGTPAKIIRISEKAPADYEVAFSTHETIKCNGDHLWTVFDRWAKKWKTVDTRWLAEAQVEHGRSRFFIPDTEPLQFPEAVLPLHPYFLGCWLGDGTNTKPAITHDQDDRQHIDHIEALGYLATKQYRQGRTVRSEFRHQGIVGIMRAMGIYGRKHIPRSYIEASIEQRCELLAGLIDTDGTVDQSRGRVVIYTTDAALAEQVQLLVLSLGMRPYITTMAAPGYGDYASDKTYHIVGFQPTMPLPTRIPRKQIDGRNFERRRRAIVSVRKSDNPSVGHCITIDRPDGLYVVGRTNVVTHNSLLCNVFWPAWEWGPKGKTSLRYVNFSYSAHLTQRDNRRFRDVLLSHDYGRLFGDRVGALEKAGETLVSNTKTGWKLATSVGGVGTGERGDRVVLDDPHNVKEGESEDVRTTTTTWFREAMNNRVNDRNSAIVVIMQRVHEEDVSGVILNELRHEYEHLCYDDQTEVLTQDGWVRFPQLQEGVPVMAVNPATLEATWQVPTHYTRLQHDGDLIAYKSQTADLMVTPDHRMVYGDVNDMRANAVERWRVRPAKDLPALFHLPQVVNWRGSDEPITLGGVEWEPSVYAEFMGWYLSEGCTSLKACTTRIVQKRGSKHVDALVQCLARIPMPKLKRRRNNNVMDVWAIGSKALARDLEPLGKSKNKRAPDALKNLAPEHLKTFLHAYALGDGQFQKRNPLKIVITTASRQMADDLQECAMKAGMASSISHSKDGAYRVYLRASKVGGKRKVAALITKKHTSRVAYSGTVYCVSVPATALVVRRNGRVSVSGNCIPYEWEGQRRISTVPQMHWNEDPREEVGQEAWSARLPTPWKSFKITLGPYAVASQYQQSPTPRGGGIIKRDWWQLWDPPPTLIIGDDGIERQVQKFPSCEFVVASFDGAFGEKQENDWSALTIWGVFRHATGVLPSSTRTPRSYAEQIADSRGGPRAPILNPANGQAPQLMLMHAWRKRLPLNGFEVRQEDGESDAEFRARQMQEWGIVQWVIHSCKKFGVNMLLVEAKANGIDVANETKRQMEGQRFGVKLMDPGRLDKVARAYAVQHIWADRMVWYPDREWADEVISEMAVFPKGGHDDYTDTATQAVKWLRDIGVLLHSHEMEREYAEAMTYKSPAQSKPLYPV